MLHPLLPARDGFHTCLQFFEFFFELVYVEVYIEVLYSSLYSSLSPQSGSYSFLLFINFYKNISTFLNISFMFLFVSSRSLIFLLFLTTLIQTSFSLLLLSNSLLIYIFTFSTFGFFIFI